MLVFLKTHIFLSYLVLFFGSYFETLIGVGFFVYGEIFFLSGAVVAGAGILNIWIVALSVVFGAALGDSSSFALGRKYGMSFFKEHHKFFNHTNYQKGQDFFNKYGTKAIFLARLLGPLSWVTPFLAGVYKIPYGQFLKYNIPGIIVGIGQFLIVGYFLGNGYQKFLSVTKNYFLAALFIILLAAGIYYIIRNIYRKLT